MLTIGSGNVSVMQCMQCKCTGRGPIPISANICYWMLGWFSAGCQGDAPSYGGILEKTALQRLEQTDFGKGRVQRSLLDRNRHKLTSFINCSIFLFDVFVCMFVCVDMFVACFCWCVCLCLLIVV